MNKPLSEWTLGEIKAECEKREKKCKGCLFDINPNKCRVMEATRFRCPDSWDLSEPPRWTEQDVKDAKALKRLIADAHHVWRGDGLNDTPLLYDEYEDQMWILNDCFAALPPRTNITLDEIIGGAE